MPFLLKSHAEVLGRNGFYGTLFNVVWEARQRQVRIEDTKDKDAKLSQYGTRRP